jgi:hypothetical protein
MNNNTMPALPTIWVFGRPDSHRGLADRDSPDAARVEHFQITHTCNKLRLVSWFTREVMQWGWIRDKLSAEDCLHRRCDRRARGRHRRSHDYSSCIGIRFLVEGSCERR